MLGLVCQQWKNLFFLFFILALILYNHFKIKMLQIMLASQTFQRLLFKTQGEQLLTKAVAPTVLASLKSHSSKKNNIVIISNGVQQNLKKSRGKRYVFSEDEICEQSSVVIPQLRQKKHLIKKQKKQDPDYSIKRQKNDRNVTSNIIHHLMKHTSSCLPEQWLNSLFLKQKINIPVSNFLQILQEKDTLCKTYITSKHLKNLWNDPSARQFSLGMRIISRLFLQNFSFLTIFNGNKLNKESKAIHYKGRRELIQFLHRIK